MAMALLLDTCALLWLGNTPERFSVQAIEAIESAPFLYASPISLWEVALKNQMGKLMLAMSPEEWFSTLKSEYGISILQMNEAIALKAATLPLLHRDPADRFIIATAMSRGLTIVTADRRYADYGVQTIV